MGVAWLSAKQPDIVIIMADDVGYSDFGCYGGEIQTPNIDRLAAGGLRFTNFTTTSKCGPSRTSLQTGKYHTRTYRSPESIDIAEGLSLGGYKCYLSGKWSPSHMSPGAPLKRGYDQFFGFVHGARSQFAPIGLVRDGKNAEHEWRDNPDFYLTDAISETAVDYIEQTPKHQPLLLMVMYNAPHWPIHARAEDIAKYKGVYAEGWDVLAEKRLERMKAMGLVPRDTPLPPRAKKGIAWADAPNKDWEQSRMEAYAAMIDRMDQGIGQIIAALRASGRFDNTLFIVTADNGASAEPMKNRTHKHFNKTTRDGRPMVIGNDTSLKPGAENTWQTYGQNWAQLSSTPFRLFKGTDHRGGHSEPLIVHWPAVIRQRGELSNELCHLIDILPTALDAAGIQYPDTFGGRSIAPPDGKSLLPVLQGREREGHEQLFWGLCLNGQAVREGPWKLVKLKKSQWELYNMDADPTELNDLAARYPEKVKGMAQAWEAWAGESQF